MEGDTGDTVISREDHHQKGGLGGEAGAVTPEFGGAHRAGSPRGPDTTPWAAPQESLIFPWGQGWRLSHTGELGNQCQK